VIPGIEMPTPTCTCADAIGTTHIEAATNATATPMRCLKETVFMVCLFSRVPDAKFMLAPRH
jgi:hypothetical protein